MVLAEIVAFTVDANSPWVVLLSVTATIIAVASFPPLRRMSMWLWCRNIAEPLSKFVDERNAVVTREVIREEVNGSIVDLGNKIDSVAETQEAQHVENHAANVENHEAIAQVLTWQEQHAVDDIKMFADLGRRLDHPVPVEHDERWHATMGVLHAVNGNLRLVQEQIKDLTNPKEPTSKDDDD